MLEGSQGIEGEGFGDFVSVYLDDFGDSDQSE